ncbi:MAG: DUF4376 domain-containing protein [Thiotrichaceae bacterium]|nr:DUF4376 domain-containing protein [Thiotrichaceae bacterium]
MIIVLKNNRIFATDVQESDLHHYPAEQGYDYVATGDVKPPRDADGNIIYPFDEHLMTEQLDVVKRKTASLKRRVQEYGGVEWKNPADNKTYTVATDATSQMKVTATLVSLQAGISTSVGWKMQSGEFVTLDVAAFASLAQAVVSHVQNAFNEEQATLQN